MAEGEELPVPEKAVRQAVLELGEAGKIRKRRSKTNGRVYLAPLERMAERELEMLLIGVMADPKSGIPVPADTKLARRVEGFRTAKAAAPAVRAPSRPDGRGCGGGGGGSREGVGSHGGRGPVPGLVPGLWPFCKVVRT